MNIEIFITNIIIKCGHKTKYGKSKNPLILYLNESIKWYLYGWHHSDIIFRKVFYNK